MRAILFVLMCVAVGYGAVSNPKPFNSAIIWEDSTYIDGTESKTMTAVWRDNGAQVCVLIEARNDSTAGFASDSAAVKIELRQLIPISKPGSKGTYPYFVNLASHAHPDSTTWPNSSLFVLYDSLDIKQMDTACVYLRSSINEVVNGQIYRTYGDTLKTLQTSGFGAFAYVPSFNHDYTPGITFKLTGKASNGKRGVGSFWRIRVFQLQGEAVRVK